MKIITKEINKNVEINNYLNIFSNITQNEICNKDVLFFDIETTGLNVKKTSTYLIGIVYYEEGKKTWVRTQFFSESLNEEILILNEFNELCKNYKYIVHFNGNHFDIPYIEEKLKKYNIISNLGQLKSLDIYTLVRDYKLHLGLQNCKQKTIETFLNLHRLDIYNGGELISQYFDYLKTNDNDLYNNLILHNAEDLEGMLELLEIINYIKLIDILKTYPFNLVIDSKSCTPEKITFSLIFNDKDTNINMESINKLRESFTAISLRKKAYVLAGYNIKVSNELSFALETTLYYGKLYHFFKDHTNYYYISEMDMAVHKSVSKNIDREKRENAKCTNCYIPKEGFFIPVFSQIDNIECFKKSYKDTQFYIPFISNEGNILINEEELISTITMSIKNLGNKL